MPEADKASLPAAEEGRRGVQVLPGHLLNQTTQSQKGSQQRRKPRRAPKRRPERYFRARLLLSRSIAPDFGQIASAWAQYLDRAKLEPALSLAGDRYRAIPRAAWRENRPLASRLGLGKHVPRPKKK